MKFIELKCGKSVEDSDIQAYQSEYTKNKYLYLIGGTHGDEEEGVYVLAQLFEWIKSNDELAIPIIVVPILNIDGYRAGTRVNSRGVDLNRNYPSSKWTNQYTEEKYNPGPSALSEPENKFLIKLFNKYPPGFILSFHSWKPVLDYNGDIENIAKFISAHNGYPISDYIGYDTFGSLGEFVPEKYSAPVLTYECPEIKSGKDLEEIWSENETGLKELLLSDLLDSYI